jgi:hypothetical protein
VPTTPGFGLLSFYYHTSVEAGGTLFVGGVLTTGYKGDADVLVVAPTYTLASPVFGGQLALSMIGVFGNSRVSVEATVTDPLGNTMSGRFSDSVTGFGDLYPLATLKWSQGVHNFMVYGAGDIPVGAYDPNRLANIGIGHAAIDGGFGYTYLDPIKGHEFSVVAGLTYNFINPDTQYQNGVDFHLDWGASQFLSKQLQVGLVGYAYQQLSCDSGAGNQVGCFESRVFGVGPQVGYILPLAEWQGYLNLKGYKEFGAENRPEGWNVWLALSLLPAAAPPPPARISMARK